MKVKSWMVKNLVTIGPDASISDAVEMMHRHSIRHLPVVAEDSMVGFVTESEIRRYFPGAVSEQVFVRDVMIVNPITINPSASIDSAARLIYKYKIGGLPVLEKRNLVGILTVTDILGAFIELLGLLKDSSRLDVILADKGETLDDVLRLIRELGGRVISVGMEAQSSRKKIHYIRLEKGDLQAIVQALEKRGHRVVSVLD